VYSVAELGLFAILRTSSHHVRDRQCICKVIIEQRCIRKKVGVAFMIVHHSEPVVPSLTILLGTRGTLDIRDMRRICHLLWLADPCLSFDGCVHHTDHQVLDALRGCFLVTGQYVTGGMALPPPEDVGAVSYVERRSTCIR